MPFIKGHKINVGRKMSEEQKEKIRRTQIGKNNSMYNKDPWNKNKKCKQLSDEKNGCWKGDSATYEAKHIWINRKLGKAIMCINHLCNNISKTYHWCNISHKYKRGVDEWVMLCAKCHAKFDGRTKCQ